MRFGKTLQESIYPPWKDKYLEYDKIKKLLREDETSPQGRGGQSSWTERDEENFVQELTNVQLEKVHQHQVDTFNALRDRITACEVRFKPFSDPDTAKTEEEKKAAAEEAIKELDAISKELTELRKFSRVNYTGFLKAAKKHDRRRGSQYRVRPILQVRLSQTPFNTEDYTPFLFRLSAMYQWAREILEGESTTSKESTTSVRPKDTYTAHKFWVHMDNLLEVKTYILRRLPVLVYNPQSVKVVDSSQTDPTTTSLYFDNDRFELYSDKIDKSGPTASLRLRWTGSLADKPEIVLEKKIVGENIENRDIRIPIKEKYIQPFLKGEYKMEKQIDKLETRHGPDSEEVKSLKANVDEIQAFIKEKKLEPIMRASYTRTAFQIPGDDRIRISIDTDLAFIREDALDPDRPCRDLDNWHRTDIDDERMEYPFSAIKKGEISRFEHAVLEIKVKDTKSTRHNAWLHDLMNSHLVKEEKKFSKFVHGIAQLFEDYVNSFPFWLSDLGTDIRRDPETAFQEEQDKEQRKVEDELAVGSFITSSKLSTSYKARIGSPGKTAEHRESVQLSRSLQPTEEEGVQAETLGSSSKAALRSFLPAFSNSRYARRHRQGPAWEDAPLPPGVKDPGKWIKDQGPLKVEAKVWLANQRTFIKWQHIAVLLATLSLGLYNAAGSDNLVARALAVVYTAFAIFAGVWGWAMYMWRSKLITERSGKDFDNAVGPFIVAIGLACALILNFVFKYTAVVADQEASLGAVWRTANATSWQEEL